MSPVGKPVLTKRQKLPLLVVIPPNTSQERAADTDKTIRNDIFYCCKGGFPPFDLTSFSMFHVHTFPTLQLSESFYMFLAH